VLTCTNVYGEGRDQILIALYVDDILIIGKHMSGINFIKHNLNSKFDMVDFGEADDILGLEITRDRDNGLLTLS
jgi:hypothetical protein